jgi:hypothetical protein|tara:strand:+ start:61 stop:1041 length:981 start_codon:yes stop_codon:yes gene_type:complete
MNGIGKIAAGMVGQATASQEARSRAPWITGNLQTRKHQSNMGLAFQALALGSSMYSTYQKGIKPHEDIQAGAKAAGIEMDEASFEEKLKIGFGFQDVGLEETYEGTTGKTQEISGVEGGWGSKLTDEEGKPYKPTAENVTEYSGATLMDIGARARSGTLESYVNQQGEGKTIGDVFGKDVTTDRFWSDLDPSYGTYQNDDAFEGRPEPTQSQPRPPDPFLQDYENKMKNYSSSMSMMDEVDEGYAPLRKGSSVDEYGYVTRGDSSVNIQSDPERAFKMAYGRKPFGATFDIQEDGGDKNVGYLQRGGRSVEFMRDGRFAFGGWNKE